MILFVLDDLDISSADEEEQVEEQEENVIEGIDTYRPEWGG